MVESNGVYVFYPFMLIMTLDACACYLHEVTDQRLEQTPSVAPATSNTMTQLSSKVTKYNYKIKVMSDPVSLKENIYINQSTIALSGVVSTLEGSDRIQNENSRITTLTGISTTERHQSLSSSLVLTSPLTHSSFLSLTSSKRRAFEEDYLHETWREQRSVSKRSSPNNKHINVTESLTMSNVTYSQVLYPNTSFSWLTNHTGTHEVLNDDNSTHSVQAELFSEATANLSSGTHRNTLYIGGLFELSGKYSENGYSELDAALLAISDINDQDVIPGYKLELLYNDSKCDPGAGTDAFFDFIYRKSKDTSLIMVMGSACTEVTKTIAEIVSYWNLILISYAATSPALSEREKYRTFFRLALGDSALNPARRMLIKYFLWDKVAAIYEDLEYMSLTFNGINKDFTSHGIVITFSTSFKDVMELPGQLKDIKELDLRIIIAGFSETTARQVFCEAYKQGMYGARYVWILVGGHTRQWWREGGVNDTGCSQSQLAAAVEMAFTVVDFNGLFEGRTSLASPASSEFQISYHRANGSLPLSVYVSSSYDTVWTIALTVRNALQEWSKNGTAMMLHQLRYEDMASVKESFINKMENLEFMGVSGHVSFKGSDREGIAVVYQIQGGNYSQVAIHQPASTSLEFNCDSCSGIFWRGGRVPKDEQVVVLRLKTIEKFVFLTTTILSISGIILSSIFLTYNLYHGHLKFIKLSSPKLNNVAVIGCILVYLAVILMGFDDRVLTKDSFPIVCSGRAFLLAAGFSLSFGAMFAKTFRVHQIFTRTHHGLVKSKLIQDTHLLVIIGVLLAVDSVMVLVWVVVDPMGRQVTNITKQVSAEDEDLIFQEQLATCHSNHLQKWLGTFYAYKGLLLIFGVYMAWETRQVKIPALNDSRYIGLNVYNVVIMSVSVVVISNILSSQPTLVYAMESAFMLLSTTVTLCLLFVPKIYVIVTSGGNPVIASMGIVVDNTNTRRFVFDDKKEIYYRAEVQNRVYKRELVELDQQIVRLERLLEIPLQPFPVMTEELLYLLPESKVDGTPRCHMKYKRELERCNSISDGGEGVVFDISESEDILMEMVFTSVNPNPLINKRYSSVETPKNSNSTLERLTRSLSTAGGSGRGRKRRKGRSLLKSPIPFCLPESNFSNTSRYGGDGQLARGMSDPHSSDTTCIHSNKPTNVTTSSRDFSITTFVSMQDKITQTSSESIFKTHGSVVGSGANSNTFHDEAELGRVQIESDGSRQGTNNQEHIFYDASNYFYPQLFSPRKEKMFAVQSIQVESVDDDSNSNNGDNDSLEEARPDWLSQSSEVVWSHASGDQEYSNLRHEIIHSKTSEASSSNTNYGSMPVIGAAPQGHQAALSWYVTTLATPSDNESSGSSNLSVCELPESQQALTIDPPDRQGSVSIPNLPLSTFLSRSSDSISQPTPHATNISIPPVTNPVPYPACLNQHSALCQIIPLTPENNLLDNINSDNVERLNEQSESEMNSLLGDNFISMSKGDNTHKPQNVSIPSQPYNISPFKTCYANAKIKTSSSAAVNLTAQFGSIPSTAFLSLREGSINPLQIYPTDINHEISTAYPLLSSMKDSSTTVQRKSSEATPRSSKDVAGLEVKDYSLPKSRGINCLKLGSTKQVLQAERRRKIQKLQDDLGRIQKELQDLNDLEHDVSEV